MGDGCWLAGESRRRSHSYSGDAFLIVEPAIVYVRGRTGMIGRNDSGGGGDGGSANVRRETSARGYVGIGGTDDVR
jgi:hypothetical protein